MHSLFVTGTDTGVGKSVVTAALVIKLRSMGVDAGFMKPFASGCEAVDGRLVSEDVQFLRDMTGVHDPEELQCPVMLEEPLAPLVAARRAGIDSANWLAVMRDGYADLCRRHEVVVVEGVGGLLVPVCESAGKIYTAQDMVETLGLPAVAVCRRLLGTINHSLLTCRTPLRAPARWLGLVFCDAHGFVPEDDIAAQTSPALIEEMTGLPVMGHLPNLPQLKRAPLEAAAHALVIPGLAG